MAVSSMLTFSGAGPSSAQMSTCSSGPCVGLGKTVHRELAGAAVLPAVECWPSSIGARAPITVLFPLMLPGPAAGSAAVRMVVPFSVTRTFMFSMLSVCCSTDGKACALHCRVSVARHSAVIRSGKVNTFTVVVCGLIVDQYNKVVIKLLNKHIL